MPYYNKHIFFCTNQKPAGKQCCALSGGEDYFAYMKTRLLELGLQGPDQIWVSKSGCLGRCASGPCVVIYPDGIWYSYSTFADIDKIIDNHLILGTVVHELLID